MSKYYIIVYSIMLHKQCMKKKEHTFILKQVNGINYAVIEY